MGIKQTKNPDGSVTITGLTSGVGTITDSSGILRNVSLQTKLQRAKDALNSHPLTLNSIPSSNPNPIVSPSGYMNHLQGILSGGMNTYVAPSYFNKGKQMGEYTSISNPKYLYRCTYNGLTWLNISTELRANAPDDQLVCSDKQVKLDSFMEKMYVKFGTKLPDVAELEFLWNIFITTDE